MSLGDFNPIVFPQLWDNIVIAEVQSPGICELGTFKRVHEFQIKKGKGTVGATVTFTQKPPAEGSAKLLLWTEEHFAQLDDFLPLLKYDPTKQGVEAVSIFHPTLAAIDISSVVCTNIESITHEGGQLYSIKLDFLEYFPASPKNAVSSPTTTNDNTGRIRVFPGEQPRTVTDVQEKTIQDLLNKAEAP